MHRAFIHRNSIILTNPKYCNILLGLPANILLPTEMTCPAYILRDFYNSMCVNKKPKNAVVYISHCGVEESTYKEPRYLNSNTIHDINLEFIALNFKVMTHHARSHILSPVIN